MNKAQTQKIRESANVALALVAEELGLQITIKNGTFDSGQVTFKVEFAEIGDSGMAMTKEAEDFKSYARRYGMTEDQLGAKFTSRGEEYTITGCAPRSRKYPILAERNDGKTYKFNHLDVCKFLGITTPTPNLSVVEIKDFRR